ncbi:MAG: zeta toxin family protein [Rickettsiales bacterium]|nr:MAG: zeta toxin family protein [Rickettsiales bacterium]
MTNKVLYIVAGANGTGKSTLAYRMLNLKQNLFFINADDIAKQLNSNDIEKEKITAGKIAINEMKNNFKNKKSFIWESTLSGNIAKNIIKEAKDNNYEIHLIYVFVDNPNVCIDRIKIRVSKGGHNVPNEDIIRRYYRSVSNFFIYKDIVDFWELYYNGISNILVANKFEIIDNILYNNFKEIKCQQKE